MALKIDSQLLNCAVQLQYSVYQTEKSRIMLVR